MPEAPRAADAPHPDPRFPWSHIETARLRMRPLEARDAPELHRLWVDPEVRRYLFDGEAIPPGRAEEEIASSSARFAAEGTGLWAVHLREREGLVGACGYRYFFEPPELQLLYSVSPAWWGRGVATEAARALIRFGFEELELPRLVAATDSPNRASVRVMEKAGMRLDRRSPDGTHGETLFAVLERQEFKPGPEPYAVYRR